MRAVSVRRCVWMCGTRARVQTAPSQPNFNVLAVIPASHRLEPSHEAVPPLTDWWKRHRPATVCVQPALSSRPTGSSHPPVVLLYLWSVWRKRTNCGTPQPPEMRGMSHREQLHLARWENEDAVLAHPTDFSPLHTAGRHTAAGPRHSGIRHNLHDSLLVHQIWLEPWYLYCFTLNRFIDGREGIAQKSSRIVIER